MKRAKKPKEVKPLPLIGPVSYYLPVENGKPKRTGLDAEMDVIVRAALRLAQGNFKGFGRFYASIRKDSHRFLTAAAITLISAIGADDPALFDAVLKDMAEFPSRYGTAEAEKAAELTMLWVRYFLRVPMACPDWFENLDLTIFPYEWRRQIASLFIGRLAQKGEYKTALLLADVVFNLDPQRATSSSAPDLRLKVAKAVLSRDSGRMRDALRWSREAVESAKPWGLVLPFLGVMFGPKTPMGRALSEGSPELLSKIRRLTNGYFRNLVKYHNRLTGDSIVESLSPREFYLAQSLRKGLRYKEIAVRMGVTPGRLRNMVVRLYETLGVNRASEIGNRVW